MGWGGDVIGLGVGGGGGMLSGGGFEPSRSPTRVDAYPSSAP